MGIPFLKSLFHQQSNSDVVSQIEDIAFKYQNWMGKTHAEAYVPHVVH